MTTILGISSFYHDSAAALIKDNEIIGAVQEERFTRKKHDSNFPTKSIKYLLKESNLNLCEVDHIAFYDKPFLKFERILETYVANSPKGYYSFRKSMPIWLKEKLFQKSLIIKKLKDIDKNFDGSRLYFSEHHYSHAASAFFCSPFEEAVILTLDGVGEWATTTISLGKKNSLKIVKEIHFPHSLGLLYSAFTYYLGFKVNSGEYKVMGLAPYGKPKYKEIILNNLVDIKEDGSFRLDQSYFNYSTGLTMTNKKFDKLFSKSARKDEMEDLEQFHMDIAASVQYVIEEIILKITKFIYQKYKIKNLCMAGGVALNCVANSKILQTNNFEKIWIQPASGDAGGAIGAAFALKYNEFKKNREKPKNDLMKGALLGPEFKQKEIEKILNDERAVYKTLEEEAVIKRTVNFLLQGKVIGWFQGKMEFGPRALGSRSIIADPRSETIQKILNLKIKYRESFRPFAPSILREDLNQWFNLDIDSPYMLFIADIKETHRKEMTEKERKMFGIEMLNVKRSSIPAVTHVDYTSRIQTVHKDINPKYYNLISEFKKKTDCPIIINTSFNVRGEPIVCSPSDAFSCFMGTNMDILVIGNSILEKVDQKIDIKDSYKNKFDLD